MIKYCLEVSDTDLISQQAICQTVCESVCVQTPDWDDTDDQLHLRFLFAPNHMQRTAYLTSLVRRETVVQEESENIKSVNVKYQ